MSKTVPASRAAQILLRKLRRAKESQNAYSVRAKIAQGHLSRVIRGELGCSLDLALIVRRDWKIAVHLWKKPPRVKLAVDVAA